MIFSKKQLKVVKQVKTELYESVKWCIALSLMVIHLILWIYWAYLYRVVAIVHCGACVVKMFAGKVIYADTNRSNPPL